MWELWMSNLQFARDGYLEIYVCVTTADLIATIAILGRMHKILSGLANCFNRTVNIIAQLIHYYRCSGF